MPLRAVNGHLTRPVTWLEAGARRGAGVGLSRRPFECSRLCQIRDDGRPYAIDQQQLSGRILDRRDTKCIYRRRRSRVLALDYLPVSRHRHCSIHSGEWQWQRVHTVMHMYLFCIFHNHFDQSDTKSDPNSDHNPNTYTKQHADASIQLNTVTCPPM